MHNSYNQYPPHGYSPAYNPNTRYNRYPMHPPHPHWLNARTNYPYYPNHHTALMDYGPKPFVVDIREVTTLNNNFRTALWTGQYFQITLMNIGVGEDIGLEMHPDVDQFIRIEEGQGLVKMGAGKDKLDFQRPVRENYAIVIPAGKWHNLINTGCRPLKLYSIYAPPEHPHGTVHRTKEIAEEQHHS